MLSGRITGDWLMHAPMYKNATPLQPNQRFADGLINGFNFMC